MLFFIIDEFGFQSLDFVFQIQPRRIGIILLSSLCIYVSFNPLFY